MIDTVDITETDSLLEGDAPRGISDTVLSGPAEAIDIRKSFVELTKQQGAEDLKDEGNPDTSKAIKQFNHDHLGRAITIKQDDKDKVIGYVLPISQDKHFVMFNNGKMFVVEPSFETYSDVYGGTFSPSESPIALGEWVTSVDKAQEYITSGDFWKVVLSNDRIDDLPQLSELRDQAIITATEQKDGRKNTNNSRLQGFSNFTEGFEEGMDLVNSPDQSQLKTEQTLTSQADKKSGIEDFTQQTTENPRTEQNSASTQAEEAFRAMEEHTSQVSEVYKELAVLESREHAGTITATEKERKKILLAELITLESNQPQLPSEMNEQLQKESSYTKSVLLRFLKYVRTQMRDIEHFYKDLPGYFLYMHKWKKGVYHEAKELNALTGLTGKDLKVANRQGWKSIYLTKSPNQVEKMRQRNSPRLIKLQTRATTKIDTSKST